MHSLPLPMPFSFSISGLKALRIDVRLPLSELKKELDTLYWRLHKPGDILFDLPCLEIDFPHLVFRYREADGEHYVYVEDRKKGCLAGYTVFNRLIELNRQQDRHLRATHSKYAPAYQRRGIANRLYRWWLDGGNNLISGARQSVGANGLWHALRADYDLIYVDLRAKTLRYLGPEVSRPVRDDLHTRMILLGKGVMLDTLARHTAMIVQCEGGAKREGLPDDDCCHR